jgi:hypothetical protein
LKNLSQRSWTSCMVLSFNSFNLKPLSTPIRESSSLILPIGQTRPTIYFFIKSLNMRMTITSSWTQTFNVWMGFFILWNPHYYSW